MRKLLLASVVAVSCLTGVQNAQAVLMGGPGVSPGPDQTFGGTTVYSYVGGSTGAFTLPGMGTLQLESSSFGDFFGYTTASHTQPTQVFSNNSILNPVGSTATINPGYSPFVFYFSTVGTNQMSNCNPANGSDCAATLYTDGSNSGNSVLAGGNDGGQANLAIYYASATNTYAFFFDDGGPSGLTAGVPNDDNDYNDLVVTYRPNSVPEPVSLALLGSGLIGLGVTRLRRSRQPD